MIKWQDLLANKPYCDYFGFVLGFIIVKIVHFQIKEKNAKALQAAITLNIKLALMLILGFFSPPRVIGKVQNVTDSESVSCVTIITWMDLF